MSGFTDLQRSIDATTEGAVYKFLTKPWDDARQRRQTQLMQAGTGEMAEALSGGAPAGPAGNSWRSGPAGRE